MLILKGLFFDSKNSNLFTTSVMISSISERIVKPSKFLFQKGKPFSRPFGHCIILIRNIGFPRGSMVDLANDYCDSNHMVVLCILFLLKSTEKYCNLGGGVISHTVA